jgi:hypothetical protein
MTGSYSTGFSNYNSDFPPSAGAGADGFSMDHPTPTDLSELSQNFRPPPLGAFGVPDGVDPFGAPSDQSTPLDVPGGEIWAAFSPDSDATASSAKMQLDPSIESSSEVEDSNIPTGSVDIEGGGAIFQSSA